MSAPTDLNRLEPCMNAAGFVLVRASTGTMDSGLAEFFDGVRTVKIVRDRGQWFVDAPRPELEQFGLWRAFDSTEEFGDALIPYVATLQGLTK